MWRSFVQLTDIMHFKANLLGMQEKEGGFTIINY